MDKALRPERFSENSYTKSAAKEFDQWIWSFEYYN